MIVVSDTSPLTGLLTVGAQDLLPTLFSDVLIPVAVQKELLKTHLTLPEWLRVVPVKDIERADKYGLVVDAGEAEAIELARETHADWLLIDERKGVSSPTKRACRSSGWSVSFCWRGGKRSFPRRVN